ncbi:MAG TPA: FlgD immunoglobulin-like domain containing protein [Candidatus Eisenbacteria bacterium]
MTPKNATLTAILLLMLPAAPLKAATWTITTIDNGPFLSGYLSMDIDSMNRSQVAYYFGSTVVFETGTLRHAVKNGGTWNLETVDPGASVGQYCTLRLDDQDRPMISYYDNAETQRNLMFAWWAPVGGWTLTKVDTTGATGQHTSLAMRGDGALSIGYFNVDSADFMVARSTLAAARVAGPGPTGAWNVQPVDEIGTVGQFGSAVFNELGGEVFTYYDASLGDLVSERYLTVGQAWQRTGVDIPGDVGRFVDTLFDPWNFLHVSYYDAGQAKLKYAAARSGRNAWYSETIPTEPGADVGRPSAIAQNPSGNVEIAYRDGRGWLMLARKVKAYDWIIEPIDQSGTVGEAIDFGIDATGRRHIVFYDATNRRLRYATAAGDPPIVGVPDDPTGGAAVLQLGAVNPNPVTTVTWIPFTTAAPGELELTIVDVSGRRVATPHRGFEAAGAHSIPWDGTDDSGRRLPNGIYFARVTTTTETGTTKLVLAR